MNVFGDATRPLEGNTQIFHLFGRVQALIIILNSGDTGCQGPKITNTVFFQQTG